MSIQDEFSSFRILLKQLYSTHTTKVKELESEVKTLKEKLIEKESEVNNVSKDCKRCGELEEAFKSCKKALNEQSKWFESFGQKFSIFSCSEVGSQDFKNAIKISNSVPETIKKGTIQNQSESSLLTLGDDTLTEEKIIEAEKIPNKNILKNVMLDNGSLESFDVLTVTFPENVKHANPSAKYDSMILAPDSLDASLEASKVNPPKLHKNKAVSNSNQGEKLRDEERNPEIKTSGKRLSAEALDNIRVKRHNAGSQIDRTCKMTNRTNVKTPEYLVPEIVVSNDVPNLSKHVEAKTKTALKDFIVPNDYRVKKHNSDIQVESGSTITKTTAPGCLVPEIVISSDLPNISKHVEAETKIATKDLSMQNVQMPKKKISGAKTDSRDNIIETPKSSINNIANDFKKKSSPYEVSPSLLPTNINALPKIIHLESATNDNDDFQDLVPSCKSVQIEDSWETCDKKKSMRKNKTVKNMKTASKFKMTLVAPPLNYKKPNYKQTKLSKSLFKAREVNSNKKTPDKSVSKNDEDDDDDIVLSEDDSVPTFLPGHCQTSTQCFRPKSLCTFDIDATFIPENFRMESPDCITSSVKKQSVEKSHFKNGGLFSSISFSEELKSAAKEEESCENEKEKNEQISFKDADLKENINSFDRLPVPEEPNFKYKNDVVRKKSERRQLTAFDCKECEKYYSDLGLSEKEKKERMKKCSRHRAKFTPPSTPDHFWELDFPDTQECKARGYMNETLKVKLNNIGNI